MASFTSAGKKVLVRKGYVTGGGDQFHECMLRWQKVPVTIVEEEVERVHVRRPGGVGVFVIYKPDLLRPSPKSFVNK